MPYVPVDINNIKLDSAPDYSNPAVREAAMRDLYGDGQPVAGYVPVDINTIKLDAPQQPNIGEDIAKSALYRGVPEGLAASTMGGIGLNVVRGVSDVTRWAGGKIYKAIEGEELPNYTENPIPTSSDVLQGIVKATTGEGLYEPQTVPGQYANTVAQFASGGKASGIPLTATIPAAVASETAGQAAKGSDYEGPARLAGALLAPAAIAGSRAAVNSFKSKAPQATSATVRSAATQAFQDADQNGGVLKPHVTDAFINNSSSILPQTPAGRIVFNQKTPSGEIINNLQSGIKGKPLTLAEAQEIDSKLGDLMSSEVDLKTGRLTAEGNNLLHIQQSLREAIEKAGASDIVGGKAGFDALNKGRKLWAAQARMNDVERIMSRAEMTDNPVTAIKTGFRTLASNPARLRGFTPIEIKAINRAAKTGIVTNALRTGGSRIISSLTGAIGGSMGGPVGSTLGAATGYVASAPLRAAANTMQRNRGNAVLDAIAGRPAVTSAIPSLQPASASPNLLQQAFPLQNIPPSILAGIVNAQP